MSHRSSLIPQVTSPTTPRAKLTRHKANLTIPRAKLTRHKANLTIPRAKLTRHKANLSPKLRPLLQKIRNRNQSLKPPVHWVLSFQPHTPVSEPLMSGVATARAAGTALVLPHGHILRQVSTFLQAPRRSWGRDNLLGPPVHNQVTWYSKMVGLT